MREIKFRGKRIDNKEWVYGDVSNNPLTKKSHIFSYDNVKSYVYEVIPETIGQFTGLHDKNCEEIYEGDKIFNNEYFGCKSSWGDCKDNFPKIRIIVFDINYSKFDMCYVEENIRDRGASGYTFCKSNEFMFEVIGNIHEPQAEEQS